MSKTETINWDRPILERFKKAHTKASNEHVKTFTFEGHEFVPGYAKYLIEYLEGRLPK